MSDPLVIAIAGPNGAGKATLVKAMKEAVRHALLTHKRAGNPIASWKDGRVVIIPADEINVEVSPDDQDAS